MQSSITSPALNRNTDPDLQEQPTVAELQQQFHEHADGLLAFALEPREEGKQDETSFKAFEAALIPMVFALGRTLVMLFLAAAEERVARRTPERMRRGGRRFRKVEAKGRNFESWFGLVRYWRTYMAEDAEQDRRGFHPLDLALGLTKDRIGMLLLSLCVRLATKLSFSEARSTAQWFLPTVPSTEVIEQAALGFGRFTAEWFERRPAPAGDGDVLVVLIDSKCVPTATKRELKKRRGKRRKAKVPKSPRHRGRQQRGRWTRRRRKKGDKSKNGKMATLVVMYTLKRQGRYLTGPINRWVYGSFAPKKHAFVIARREANKRGFTRDSGKVVQLLTDGDKDLEVYGKDLFPEAQHTLDVIHVVEKLWEAGGCLHPEGSEALEAWVNQQKKRLYGGQVGAIIGELVRHLSETPKTGPGNKGKRQRLDKIISYLNKRTTMMNYDELLAEDLEISTGQIEGAIKYILGRRCDHGGMRWIKERAEAILQLRCIDFNGDWDGFIDHIHETVSQGATQSGKPIRIQQNEPHPLPEVTKDAA